MFFLYSWYCCVAGGGKGIQGGPAHPRGWRGGNQADF